MTDSDVTADRLELILGGHVFFQTLRAAIDVDVFTLLARTPGLSLEGLARAAAVAEMPMRILLLGCTALGLIERRAGDYYNSSLGEKLFSRDSSDNIIPTVEFQHRLVYRPMFHLAEAVRENRNVGLAEFPGEGNTLYERLALQPDLQRVFHKSLETTTRSNVEQLLANVDFSTTRHVVDIGGGNGTALCALANRYPGLRATLVESASVCDLAREHIATAGLTERLSVYSCDCFLDPFPEGADCFLFMHFLTIWSGEQNLFVLRKAFEAMPSGGTVVVFDGAQSNDQCGPLRAARWSPYFLALSSGHGMFYTSAEYAGWIQQAGFTNLKQVLTAPDHTLITARKP
jgi:hypothetical protein